MNSILLLLYTFLLMTFNDKLVCV